jgi:hypothetical protein
MIASKLNGFVCRPVGVFITAAVIIDRVHTHRNMPYKIPEDFVVKHVHYFGLRFDCNVEPRLQTYVFLTMSPFAQIMRKFQAS